MPAPATTPLMDATTAALGSLAADLAVYPIELHKTRVQAQIGTPRRKAAAQRDGTDGTAGSEAEARAQRRAAVRVYSLVGLLRMYEGVSWYVCKSALQNFVYFFIRRWITNLYVGRTRMGMFESMALSSAAGCITLTGMLPFDVIDVRCKTSAILGDDGREGPLAAARGIYKDGGLAAFWNGLGVAYVLTSNPALTFTAFDKLKLLEQRRLVRSERRQGRRPKALGTLHTFAIASAAKSVATVLTYPLIRAKVIMQSRRKRGGEQGGGGSSGVMDLFVIWGEVMKAEGYLGVYDGLGAQLSKSVLSSALLLMTKDQTEAAIIRALRRLAEAKGGGG